MVEPPSVGTGTGNPAHRRPAHSSTFAWNATRGTRRRTVQWPTGAPMGASSGPDTAPGTDHMRERGRKDSPFERKGPHLSRPRMMHYHMIHAVKMASSHTTPSTHKIQSFPTTHQHDTFRHHGYWTPQMVDYFQRTSPTTLAYLPSP